MDDLVRKMQQDMEIQNYSPRTVEAYLFHVKRFQSYLPKPLVLSADEIHAILNSTRHPKHRLVLMTLYSGGLRLNEGIHLRITDIDSQRMTIRVRQGKGNRDRYTLLSSVLLNELRLYWLRERPDPWLFPGRNKDKPLSVRHRSRKRFTGHASKQAFAKKHRSIHYATVLRRICLNKALICSRSKSFWDTNQINRR